MAYGNEHGLVIVDIVQKVCLLNVASPDLYGAQDPYSRTPRSPKRAETTGRDEQTRSPSIDQVSNTFAILLYIKMKWTQKEIFSTNNFCFYSTFNRWNEKMMDDFELLFILNFIF